MTATAVRPPVKNQSSIFASGLAMLGAAVTLIATFGIARLVSQDGQEIAGIFFLTTAIVSVAGTGSSLGTQLALVYFMPRAMEQEQPNPRNLLYVALRPVVLVSVVLAILTFTFAYPIGDLISDGRARDVGDVLRILAPAIPAWALSNALLGATRGLGTVTPTVVVQQVGRPLLQILGLVGLAIAGELTPIAIAIAWGAPVIIAALGALGAVVYLGGFAGNGPGHVSSGEFWRYARPNALSTSLQIAHERIDVVIIGALLGSGPAGIYGALTRYATAGNFIAYALTQAISPNLRRAINAGRDVEAKRLFHAASGWMVITNLPYLLIVATKFEPLARLFNAEFVAESDLLTLVVVGMIVSALCGPVELHLLMRGHSTTTLLTTAFSLFVDVALVFILADWLGIKGAAIAWAISLSAKNLINTYFSHRRHGVSSYSRPATVATAGAVLAVLPIALLTPNDFTGLVITTIVGGAFTLGFIWLNRGRLDLAA